MAKNNDEIESLFRNLPKAPAFSEIERKHQEKLIRAYVADMAKEERVKQNSLLKRFPSQFSLAAGFIVLVAGISFALNQDIFETKEDLSITMPIPENQGPSSTEPKNLEQENSEPSQPSSPRKPGTTDQGGVEEFESAATNGLDLDKFINNSGLDYLGDIGKVKQAVKISALPISISEIPQSYGKCAIQLGINKELLGIDKGSYDGVSVLAFYYGRSKSTASIWIVEKPCTKLQNIQN
jgi:hypothetical protein